MKKQIQLLIVMAAFTVGLAACQKDGVTKTDGAGSVMIKFGMPASPGSKAVSGKKPLTTWANIKDLMVLFVKDGTVIDARSVYDAPQTGEITEKKAITLKNVVAGAGIDAYLVANSRQPEIACRNNWTPENAKGKLIADLYMDLVAHTGWQATGYTGNGYQSPSEIFVATKNITIEADKDNDGGEFALTRAVSLIRVRLKPVGDNASKIDFTGAGMGDVQLRRVHTGLNPLLGLSPAVAALSANDVIYSSKSFSIDEPAAGFSPGANILGDGVTCYQDFLSFAGGHETLGAQKFDIVIKGTTRDATYVPAGTNTPVAAGTPIYWTGAINQAITANGILDVELTVQSSGAEDVPPVGSYGNLKISVVPTEWGNIVGTELPV